MKLESSKFGSKRQSPRLILETPMILSPDSHCSNPHTNLTTEIGNSRQEQYPRDKLEKCLSRLIVGVFLGTSIVVGLAVGLAVGLGLGLVLVLADGMGSPQAVLVLLVMLAANLFLTLTLGVCLANTMGVGVGSCRSGFPKDGFSTFREAILS